MHYTKRLFSYLMGITLLFPSCDGIFEDIYDTPQVGTYGFKEIATAEKAGTIYVNASEYTRWIYINFHQATIDSISIVHGGEEYKGEWDIAVHRYDAKTNGGAVLATNYKDIEAFRKNGSIPEGTFVEDVETDSTIITDMSQMMDGVIGYAKGKVNIELSKWLNCDTSTMPPIYTLSENVYVVKLKDGTKAAVKLSNFMSEGYDKGYLTIHYAYPLNF